MNIIKPSGYILIFCIIFHISHSHGQETFPRNDISDVRPDAMVLTNATIIIDPLITMENATLIINNGIIESVNEGTSIPDGYTEIDLKGHYIYPSFIDMFSNYGQPEVIRPKRVNPFVKKEQVQSNTKGAYNANEAIKSGYNSVEHFVADEKQAAKLRAQGFGTVAAMRPDGIARGSAALVVLGDDRENNMVIKPKVASHYSFDKGSSTQDYPISPMGSIALLRQTFYDVEWYASYANKPFTDLSLEAIIANKDLPQIIETSGWLTAMRANKLGKEFNINFIIKGGGDEYQRIEEIKRTNSHLIIPINFPSNYNITDPYITQKISLADLKHWELAPSNPSRLEEKGISFAITAYPPDNISDFLKNLRKSVAYGLGKEKALSSLTTVPAKLLKADDLIGSLKKGKLANFIITDGDLFDKGTVLLENWIKGKRFILNELPKEGITGAYSLKAGTLNAIIKLEVKHSKYTASLLSEDGSEQKVDFKMDGDLPVFQFEAGGSKYHLKGWIAKEENKIILKGTGTINFEQKIDWIALKNSEEKNNESRQGSNGQISMGKVFYPFMAYGSPEKIKPERILVTNATVWTNEAAGILTNTDVLLEEGKIAKIGKNLNADNATVMDGTGKHLTPGIIDEHSHIALSGINEIAPNSGMVRMVDVIDSEDPGIYWALAGGVVAAQLLHGSSDPVGGQSAFIKLKWGEGPEGLIIKDAAPFIKFALGENPKRSKSEPSIRFPRSLMGLEQFYTNAFSEALDYEKSWELYNQLIKKREGIQPRKDLVHEAMLEILKGHRFITAHSYQQKEMLMLMDVAERFGFTLNTFTHALEGYRIADKMLEHGVGGSTFSDRWNFKWETRNAIPYNATIMNNEGVVTAINSDSGETMRHLNHEAAKAIKYGGTNPEEALKMITLNPAKLLRLDKTMGSIKVGKSADVVLWSGPPLSLYSKPEKTIVEGAVYFDLARDQRLREQNLKERSRILKTMESQEVGKNETAKISMERPEFDCEYIELDD